MNSIFRYANTESRPVEWPTWGLIIAFWAAFGALTWSWALLPWWILCPVGAYLVCLHGSLQHEALHGHPTRSPLVNEFLVFPSAVAVDSLSPLPQAASHAPPQRRSDRSGAGSGVLLPRPTGLGGHSRAAQAPLQHQQLDAGALHPRAGDRHGSLRDCRVPAHAERRPANHQGLGAAPCRHRNGLRLGQPRFAACRSSITSSPSPTGAIRSR